MPFRVLLVLLALALPQAARAGCSAIVCNGYCGSTNSCDCTESAEVCCGCGGGGGSSSISIPSGPSIMDKTFENWGNESKERERQRKEHEAELKGSAEGLRHSAEALENSRSVWALQHLSATRAASATFDGMPGFRPLTAGPGNDRSMSATVTPDYKIGLAEAYAEFDAFMVCLNDWVMKDWRPGAWGAGMAGLQHCLHGADVASAAFLKGYWEGLAKAPPWPKRPKTKEEKLLALLSLPGLSMITQNAKPWLVAAKEAQLWELAWIAKINDELGPIEGAPTKADVRKLAMEMVNKDIMPDAKKAAGKVFSTLAAADLKGVWAGVMDPKVAAQSDRDLIASTGGDFPIRPTLGQALLGVAVEDLPKGNSVDDVARKDFKANAGTYFRRALEPSSFIQGVTQ